MVKGELEFSILNLNFSTNHEVNSEHSHHGKGGGWKEKEQLEARFMLTEREIVMPVLNLL